MIGNLPPRAHIGEVREKSGSTRRASLPSAPITFFPPDGIPRGPPASPVALATSPAPEMPSSGTRVGSQDLVTILSMALLTAADATNSTPEEAAIFTSESTLTEVATQAGAHGVSLDRLLGEVTVVAFHDRVGGSSRALRQSLCFISASNRPVEELEYAKGQDTSWHFNVVEVEKAMIAASEKLESI